MSNHTKSGRRPRGYRSVAQPRSASSFKMIDPEIWEGRGDSAASGRYKQAMNAFNHADYTTLREGSIPQRVAEAVIYSFPVVQVTKASSTSHIHAAIMHVKGNLVKRANADDERLIHMGINIARTALYESYYA